MKTLLVITILSFMQLANSQSELDSIDYNFKAVNWMTWDQAQIARSIVPKKIFVFIYDEANPESAKMESVAFKDTVVNIYLNNYYYCVRLNAKSKDTVLYMNRVYFYDKDKATGKSWHSLAQSLSNYKGIYPCMVIFDEAFKRKQFVNGYINPEQTSMMLARFAHNEHLKEVQAIKFGQKFQCQDPNHPHNRLRQMYQSQSERDKIKSE